MQPQNDTKMVKPQSKTKIRMLRDAYVGETVAKEGSVVEVDESLAKELCDTVFKGPPQFRGERESNDPNAQMSKITRAVRL